MTAESRARQKKRPTKGALIKGMTGKLPVEILDSPVFRADIRKLPHYDPRADDDDIRRLSHELPLIQEC